MTTNQPSAANNNRSFRIFISSTAIDLKQCREKVAESILRLEQFPIDMKNFGAAPEFPVTECKKLAAAADAVVVIVAHRYGYVPGETEGGDNVKSITWHEVDAALDGGRPVFAFIVDPDAPWTQPKEQDLLLPAATRDSGREEAIRQVADAVKGLEDFKKFLWNRLTCATFSNSDDLQAKVATTLAPWLMKNLPHASAMPAKTWLPRVVHPLQPAPHFQGRAETLSMLQDWWREPVSPDRVMALVAIGGTGKTALAEKLLQYAKDNPKPAGVFVWSFYEDHKIEAFLREACEYFSGDGGGDEAGGRLERLQVALATGDPHLLLLDGVERVQVEGEPGRTRGELNSHQLKLLLRSLAAGTGRARALLTSRFDLVDLHDWARAGYYSVRLDDLEPSAARALLRAWGGVGSDQTLDHVANLVGRHALSVSVLGSYLSAFHNGDPDQALALDLAVAAEDDVKAAKLAKVLASYAQALQSDERDLLARLSTFTRGIKMNLLHRLVEAGGMLAGALDGYGADKICLLLHRLKQRGLIFAYGEGEEVVYTAHPFLRSYFKGLLGVPAYEVHEAVRSMLAPSLESSPDSLPVDPNVLDRYEELIEHTMLAGRVGDALHLYRGALGGYGHLGVIAGEYTRGARIVDGFTSGRAEWNPALSQAECSYLAYERGMFAFDLGESQLARRCLEYAIRDNDATAKDEYQSTNLRELAYLEILSGLLPDARRYAESSLQIAAARNRYNREALSRYYLGYCECLLGNIREAAQHFTAARSGSDSHVHILAGFVELDYLLKVGDTARALPMARDYLSVCQRRRFYRNGARCHSILGRLYLPDELTEARTHLAAARDWTSRTGDVEVLIRAYMLASEIAMHSGDLPTALAEVKAGLQLAEGCKYDFYVIDLMLLLAQIKLAVPDARSALQYARQALERSADPKCNYGWGESDALHLAGLAHQGMSERDMARKRFEEAVRIRARIEHPSLSDSQSALDSLMQ